MPEAQRAALEQRLDRGLAALGLTLDERARARLVDYVELLARWNRAYNLSAVRDPEAMVTRHVVDSLAALPWVGDGTLLDIGTGPGLPGIPLAIVRDGLAVTLLDSNGKKTRFLNQAVMALGLERCRVVQTRAVDADGEYDMVTSRAFAALDEFWRVAAPRLAPEGRALALKGRYPGDELSALTGMGVSWRSFPLEVPDLDAERHLVELTPEPATASPRQN